MSEDFSDDPGQNEKLQAEGDAEEDDEEYKEGEEGEKRKHHHRHHHHHKHKHYRKTSSEEADPESPEEEGAGGKRKKKKVSGGGKKTKKAKLDQENDLELQQKTDEQVDRLINEMVATAQKDKEFKAEGKTAMEKLKSLPRIKSELKKIHYHEPFLSKNGLEALFLWIQRHEDGSYPCLDILEGIIDICDELPITTDNLLETGRELARTIKDISINNDSEQIRVKAKRLVSKWSRGIYGVDADGHNLSEKEHGYTQFLRHISAARKKPQAAQTDQPKGSTDFEDVKTAPRRVNKTELPVKGTLAALSKVGFDFVQRPVSELVVDRRREESNLTPLMKRMIHVKREGKKKPIGNKYKDIA